MTETFPEGFIPIGDAFAQALTSIKDLNSVLGREPLEGQEHINRLLDEYDVMARDVEGLMRGALADGNLPAFKKTESGQMEQITDRKSWLQRAFGAPCVDNVPHHLTNPGPDTDGHPAYLKSNDFNRWLNVHRVKKNKRVGAPIKYDWPDAKKFAFRLLNERGDFREWDSDAWKTPADLGRCVLAYMEKSTGEGRGPAPSTLRAKVAEWIAEWQTNANK